MVIGVERQGALSVLISSSGAPSDHHKINISTAIQRIIYAGRTRERDKKYAARKCVARKIWIFTGAAGKYQCAAQHTRTTWRVLRPECAGAARARFRSLILFGPRGCCWNSAESLFLPSRLFFLRPAPRPELGRHFLLLPINAPPTISAHTHRVAKLKPDFAHFLCCGNKISTLTPGQCPTEKNKTN